MANKFLTIYVSSDMIRIAEELLRYDHVVHSPVCEGLNLCGIHLAVQIDALGFFRKDHRNAEILGCDASNADSGRFDGQDLVDRAVSEQTV